MITLETMDFLSDYLGDCEALCFVCKNAEHGGRGKCGCEEQCCYSIGPEGNDASFRKMVESIIVDDTEYILLQILRRQKLRKEDGMMT